MNAPAEIAPFEEPLLPPESELGGLLGVVQREGFPAYIGWSREIAEGTFGHIVEAHRTRRVVALIEHFTENGSQWLALNFRVRREADKPTLFEDVCQQMVAETASYEADERHVLDLLRTLYLGCGMELQYEHVILECNRPPVAETFGDAQTVSHTPWAAETRFREDLSAINISDVVQHAFMDNNSELATLAIDIGTHMGEHSRSFLISGEEITVYRTQLHNYPWAYDEHGPLTKDLVLVKANGGSIWYINQVPFDIEIGLGNLASFMNYTDQLISMDVPVALIEGIVSRIEGAKGPEKPAYLMANLLKRQTASDIELELIVGENPYDYLAEPTAE